MYIPEPFHERDSALALAHIRRHPFATLTGMRDGELWSVHLPFTVAAEGPQLRLQAHLARANPFSGHLARGPLLLHFIGPQSYVSPHWYSHKVHFPTWIYSAVHVRGRARILAPDELHAQLLRLIAEQEQAAANRAPWDLAVMPAELTDRFKTMVVGFELVAERIETCFKLNQHKQGADLDAMERQLRLRGDDGRALADLTAQARLRTDADVVDRYLNKYQIKD